MATKSRYRAKTLAQHFSWPDFAYSPAVILTQVRIMSHMLEVLSSTSAAAFVGSAQPVCGESIRRLWARKSPPSLARRRAEWGFPIGSQRRPRPEGLVIHLGVKPTKVKQFIGDR